MERAFVDTGAWFANANPADPDHAAAHAALKRWAGRLVTSNFVFDETVTLLRMRLGHSAAVAMGNALLSGDLCDTIRLNHEDEKAAWDLLCARADKQYSFTDCTSFVLMRRLGLSDVVAVDEDFAREGFVVAIDPAQR